jgi:hypothetical protein
VHERLHGDAERRVRPPGGSEKDQRLLPSDEGRCGPRQNVGDLSGPWTSEHTEILRVPFHADPTAR